MRPRHGFTLVELLLVVVILAALAAAASSTVDGAYGQARFDDTRTRLELLRAGVIGSEEPGSAISGYVADVGALPESVSDLLRPRQGVPSFAVDPTFRIGFGWRGPYVRGVPRSSDARLEFPDGWGTPDVRNYADPLSEDPNFGWRWSPPPPELRITSVGADGALAGAIADDQSELIAPDDYMAETAGWQVTATIELESSIAPEDLAIRILWPDGDDILAGLVDDPREILGLVVGQTVPLLPAGDHVLTFEIATTPSRPIPQGIRPVVLCKRSGSTTKLEPVSGQLAMVEFRPRAFPPTTLARRFVIP